MIYPCNKTKIILEDLVSPKGQRGSAHRRDCGWDLPGSCYTGILTCRLMLLIIPITHCKEFQSCCDKIETHTGNKSGKLSRTASMFMRVAIKKINVQEIYKCNLISSYYRYRNYLIILLEIHLYLFLMPENLQNPKQWLGWAVSMMRLLLFTLSNIIFWFCMFLLLLLSYTAQALKQRLLFDRAVLEKGFMNDAPNSRRKSIFSSVCDICGLWSSVPPWNPFVSFPLLLLNSQPYGGTISCWIFY